MLYFSPRFLYFRYIPAVAARRHGLFSPHDEEFSVNKIPALLLLIIIEMTKNTFIRVILKPTHKCKIYYFIYYS
ncbi:hypothetical protein CSJ79_03990 [Salmonella enterica]|nr:hypothetical protein [Salmonella enterica]EAY2919499.1 hypothetical protein [Salmonella enterica subsp. enterica serovar Typhimurium]EAB3229661.1 hypothetical protein [Salmonella enterica]EAM2025501.1 hypothetical protein [Salmonella enterica]EAN9036457.1 hypothetical protein [Salmonella enterica]